MNLKFNNRDNPFPFYVCFGRNEYFFAKMQWFLYKKFNKTRIIPCGRTRKNSYLCCCQPIEKEYCYLSEDKKRVYCKCCNHERVSSNRAIDLDHLHDF